MRPQKATRLAGDGDDADDDGGDGGDGEDVDHDGDGKFDDGTVAHWHLCTMGHAHCLERPAILSTAICQAHHQYMHCGGIISGMDF